MYFKITIVSVRCTIGIPRYICKKTVNIKQFLVAGCWLNESLRLVEPPAFVFPNQHTLVLCILKWTHTAYESNMA